MSIKQDIYDKLKPLAKDDIEVYLLLQELIVVDDLQDNIDEEHREMERYQELAFGYGSAIADAITKLKQINKTYPKATILKEVFDVLEILTACELL